MDSHKSRGLALALSIVLGGFGVHRFYARKYGTGIIQCLLTLTGVGLFVCVPWVFYDIIVIAAGNFKDKDGFLLTNW